MSFIQSTGLVQVHSPRDRLHSTLSGSVLVLNSPVSGVLYEGVQGGGGGTSVSSLDNFLSLCL